jgi:hypothetical protein
MSRYKGLSKIFWERNSPRAYYTVSMHTDDPKLMHNNILPKNCGYLLAAVLQANRLCSFKSF